MKKIGITGDWAEYSTDGNPLHNVFENKKTGETSYQDHQPIKITHYDECKEHYFELVSPNGDLQCQKCQYSRKIVWGIHICKDGKIVKL